MLASKKSVKSIVLHRSSKCISSMYLVAIAVANRVKVKFYKEDIPNFENVGTSPPLLIVPKDTFIAQFQIYS